MGILRKQRKKFSKPRHPWQRVRIEQEGIIVKEYGLRRKKEIYKANSLLKNVKKQAKNVIASTTPQAEIEKKQLLARLAKFNLIKETANPEDILDLKIEDILERRRPWFRSFFVYCERCQNNSY